MHCEAAHGWGAGAGTKPSVKSGASGLALEEASSDSPRLTEREEASDIDQLGHRQCGSVAAAAAVEGRHKVCAYAQVQLRVLVCMIRPE